MGTANGATCMSPVLRWTLQKLDVNDVDSVICSRDHALFFMVRGGSRGDPMATLRYE
jgi:hypothetical protein